MSFKLMTVMLAVPLLAGCETLDPVSESKDPGFGESVKYNAAVQTIDPDPVYTAKDAQPGADGDRAAGAVKRYRSGQVTPVEALSTSSGPN